MLHSPPKNGMRGKDSAHACSGGNPPGPQHREPRGWAYKGVGGAVGTAGVGFNLVMSGNELA